MSARNRNLGRPARPTKRLSKFQSLEVANEVMDVLHVTAQETMVSVPHLAACTKPDPPSAQLPVEWREYFVKMARYGEALRYRRLLSTRHALPDDWWDKPSGVGLDSLLDMRVFDHTGLAALLQCDLDRAKRLMSSGEIPSYKIKGLPLITTDRDIIIYLASVRVVDDRHILRQAGWQLLHDHDAWQDPVTGKSHTLPGACRILVERQKKKFSRPT